jgi:hypothetical protein
MIIAELFSYLKFFGLRISFLFIVLNYYRRENMCGMCEMCGICDTKGNMKCLKTGILAGIAIFVVMWIVSLAAQAIFAYDVLKLDGMRAVTDPIMILFFVYPWVLAFAMTCVYLKIERLLEGDWMAKGKQFGCIIWIVAGIPSAFLIWSSMNYPIGFTISSLVGSLLYMIAGGIVIAWSSKAPKTKAKKKR